VNRDSLAGVRPYLVILLLTFLAGCAAIATHLRPADPQPTSAPGPGVLRVLSANIYTMNRAPLRLASALVSMHPHMIVVQERSESSKHGKQNIDLDTLRGAGYEVVLDEVRERPGTHGATLLSRGVRVSRGVLQDAPWKGPCRIPLAIARIPGNEITLIGIHAPPPGPDCSGTNRSALMSVAARIERGRLKDDFGSGRRGDRVIVAGDLNAVPWDPAVLWLSLSGLRDGYARARWLPGSTYSPWADVPKFVRLDYVLTPFDAGVSDAWIVDLPGSDHRGVVVDIDLGSSLR
jgi:endonuclease/exonuclease/phosphatase (EEP) superfamily protein YafD